MEPTIRLPVKPCVELPVLASFHTGLCSCLYCTQEGLASIREHRGDLLPIPPGAHGRSGVAVARVSQTLLLPRPVRNQYRTSVFIENQRRA